MGKDFRGGRDGGSRGGFGGGFGGGSRGGRGGFGGRGGGRDFPGRQQRGGFKNRQGGGGRQGLGMKGGQKQVIVAHDRFEGIFLSKGKEDALVTKNLAPGESVYGEKRIAIEDKDNNTKIEYRVWNPYRSKIAAAIIGGIGDIYIKPGAKVLYLGAASGTTVSHVSDIVGENGVVYAVEFSHRSGRDLVGMAKKRTNVIPIIADARKPLEYRIFLTMVDVVFADVAQPDQARIVGLNCQYFLKNGGHFVISIKANCIDSTNEPTVVFENEVQRLREEGLTPVEQLTLEPYERDHAVVIGTYKAK